MYNLLTSIKAYKNHITLVKAARKNVVAAVNVALVYTYYEVGRMIV